MEAGRQRRLEMEDKETNCKMTSLLRKREEGSPVAIEAATAHQRQNNKDPTKREKAACVR